MSGSTDKAAPSSPLPKAASPRGKHLALLSLAALGVVYGDIGTSPLYALRECFSPVHALVPTPANVLGVLSLILWALLLIISVKYQIFLLRADNRGEGGILALLALLPAERRAARGTGWVLAILGLFGAALLYGDGMITPAISVLSAIEGLELAAPALHPLMIPLTVLILVGLFAIQSRGTAGVGAMFGPVTLVWFFVIGGLGVSAIVRRPEVLGAINPWHAAAFFHENGRIGFLVLGSVFLAVTGGEALYADMGHFGRRPIRATWFGLVLPALVLNYFGQGAVLLENAAAADNPFYRLAPPWALYPMIALATAATIIASQAVISGAFSLTRQAVQLGYSPRVEIIHTSSDEIGQIYVPTVNWALMVTTVTLVLGFRTSTNMASAYGVAVTTTMVITTVLASVIARDRWKWSLPVVAVVGSLFLAVDLSFFGANIIKVLDGGWVALLVAAVVFTILSTWKRGRELLMERFRRDALPLDAFLADVQANPPVRVPGTAVFMTGNPQGVPPALLHNVKHNKVLHEQVVVLTVMTAEIPHVPTAERVQVEWLGEGFFRVLLRYGFMQDPNVPKALKKCRAKGLDCPPMETTYFLGRETLLVTPRSGLSTWRGQVFAFLTRNAQQATAFFRIPPNRVVELGAQVEL